MTVYLDTSVIVALVAEEPTSKIVRHWFRNATDRLIVSDLVRLEFSAFVSRAVRTKRFDADQAALALKSFEELRKSCDVLEHTPRDFSRADELIREFATKLAAADALHLASALAANMSLLTLDTRLQDAARSNAVAIIAVG
ncbi:MAG: type II toxin-antitoxin system VapC family toxin [Methylobacteriaceae bacterium]|nr:type II toxin-antitoxin system VapC family toxin [Methylobacteriaceae bacterium]